MNIYRRTLKSAGLCAFVLSQAVFSQATHAESILFEDNFETGLGNWQNTTQGDDNNWTRHSGNTTSSYTGPSSGSNSNYYVYLETSSGSAYYAGNSAILLSPNISGSDIKVSFDYHMLGIDTGELSLDVMSQGNWVNDVWSLAGAQHTATTSPYTSTEVDLSHYSVSQVRFRASAVGGYRGDIALDNLKILSSPLGPVAPEFLSSPIQKDSAIQDQPYTASLATDAYDQNGDLLGFAKVSGPEWLSIDTNGNITGTPSSADLGENSFVVSVSDGSLSREETLQFTVTDGSIPTIISSDNFELGQGNWSNATSGDNKNWLRHSGSTPSSGTGPNGGNSSGNSSGYYMYLETSSGSAYTANDSAILNSPTFAATNVQLSFSYHMYGSNIGTLFVDGLSNGTWINNLWSLSGQQQSSNGASYQTANIDLTAYDLSKLRIRAVAKGGYTGDIAIDDILISGVEATASDSDNDGMPDNWELQYGLNPTLNDAQDDLDNDGSSNLEEFLQGTDPSIANISFDLTPSIMGAGIDGGDSGNWKIDGQFDQIVGIGNNMIIQKYRSLDNTKKSEWRAIAEYQLPISLLNSNRTITSAKLTTTLAGKWTDSMISNLDVYGYTGDLNFELADLAKTTNKAGTFDPNTVSNGQTISIDVTDYINNLNENDSPLVGFVFSMYYFTDRVDLSKDLHLEIEFE